MQKNSFKTIKEPSKGVFKDKRSEFYAFAYPINSEDEADKIRKELRKKYYDAKHHVYAYRLGHKNPIEKMSDDGEPHNSSAPPIMNQIKSYDLTNVLIVVIRYFGGKKLGIPGLINAYKTAAKSALENAQIIEKKIEQSLILHINYNELNGVMKIIKNSGFEIVNIDNKEKCSIEIGVSMNKLDDAIKKFKAANIDVEIGKEREKPI